MLIDTHCHLDFKDFNDDRESVIARSREEGIEAIINVGSSLEGTYSSIYLAKKFDLIHASVGIHPHDAKKIDDEKLRLFRNCINENRDHVVAIGEIGLDYYRNLSPKEAQKGLFISLLEEAKVRSLPIIIHNRDADNDTIPILKDVMGNDIKGVMHCFSGDKVFLKECLDLGLHISFTCNITFKNAGDLREVAKLVPMDRLMLETDAPFLAPQVFRGKRNEPSYVKYLCQALADIKGLDYKEIARITTATAKTLFKLK
ncbi:MAG: TatD family hydrolase [Candidatus Omnitrophota bacterium]